RRGPAGRHRPRDRRRPGRRPGLRGRRRHRRRQPGHRRHPRPDPALRARHGHRADPVSRRAARQTAAMTTVTRSTAAPPPDPAALRDEAAALLDDVVALRRDLHRRPELGLDLPRTQARVLEALDGLPLTVRTGDRLSSVVADLDGDRPGPTVLLRGDMDALPVTEDTGLDYASEVPGAMHACGHDVHTAMLVGAARLLAARRREIAGRVRFLFQPGEEGQGGAALAIGEGG